MDRLGASPLFNGLLAHRRGLARRRRGARLLDRKSGAGGDVGGGTDFGFDGGAELDVAGGVPGTIAVEPGREGDVVFGGDGDGGTFDRDGGAADPFAAVVVTGAGRCGWVGGGGPAHHVHA